MKHIKLLALILVGLQSTMYAAQEAKQEEKQERQAIIDSVMEKYSGLQNGFDFLQENGLGNQSFHEFLEDSLPSLEDSEENTEFDFDGIIQQAEDRIDIRMKDTFISTLKIAIKENKTLDQFKDPIFSYVMLHKDDYMYGMVRLWLFEWSKIQDTGVFGNTPLHSAAGVDSTEVLCMLISAGTDVNIKNNFGETPLHWAAYYGNNKKITQLLIDAKANVNIKSHQGNTPLYWAVLHNKIDVVQLLINAGADLNIQNNEGSTAEDREHTPEMHALFAQVRYEKALRQAAGCTIS